MALVAWVLIVGLPLLLLVLSYLGARRGNDGTH